MIKMKKYVKVNKKFANFPDKLIEQNKTNNKDSYKGYYKVYNKYNLPRMSFKLIIFIKTI